MTVTSDPTAEAAVRAEIARERAEAARRLASHERSAVQAEKEYEKAGKAVSKLFRRATTAPDEDQVLSRWHKTGNTLRQIYGAAAYERTKIAALDNPGEVDRRLSQRSRRISTPSGNGEPRRPRSPERKVSNMAATGTQVEKPDRDETIKACRAALKKHGGDAVKAAEELNSKKVPTLRGVVGRWAASRLQWTADKDLGGGAATKPAARKPAARKPAAKKNGNGSGGSGGPISKSEQASGTSRGGTGTKKAAKKAAADAAAAAKTSSTQAARSRGGSRRSGTVTKPRKKAPTSGRRFKRR